MEGREARSATCSQARLADVKPRTCSVEGEAHRGRRRHRGLDHLRDRGRARLRPSAPEGRQDLDAADHDGRAEGPRGEEGRAAARAPSTASARAQDLAGTSARRRPRRSATTTQPYVVIIGGGQGGIALGARLRQLGVPTIIVEKNERPGDSWRKRYKSLCLHDPVWYDHLPYMPFPDDWPVFSPKDKIGDWLEMYTQGHGAELLDQHHCQEAPTTTRPRKEWTVVVERDGEGRSRCGPSSWCFATGMSGKPNMPEVPGHETLPGRAAPLAASTPAPTTTRARRCVVHRLQQLGARHLRRAVGARRRRHDGPALVARTSCRRTR